MAAGQPLAGGDDVASRGLGVPDRPDPRGALQAELALALGRPPCVVSFSGGRDSSAVLAAAIDLARREGFEDPIPATLRFPGLASAEEDSWQEQVIAHLGVTHWERIEISDQLDLLGPLALAGLRSHGLLWPANSHFHVPLLDLARGGSLLTGYDGDGLFGTWRSVRVQAVLHARIVPQARDIARVGLALAPPALRLKVRPPGELRTLSWLRPDAHAAAQALCCAEVAGEPRRWDRWVRWYADRRYHQLAQHALGLLGGERDVRVMHPLLAPAYLGAVAAHGGAVGYGERRDAMRDLFGDLLPDAVLVRRSKAAFGGALWMERTREWVAHWDGSGCDDALVDPERLRAAWLCEVPLLYAATSLHAAWLAAD